MKCPKCHKEVERGSLYCPNCLAEIPWVKEFDSVETQLKKQEQTMAKHPVESRLRQAGKELYRNRKKIFLLAAFITAFIGMFVYRQLHTFSALYNRAQKYYAEGDSGRSLQAVEAALEKEPLNLNASLLFARLLKEQGDTDSAILVLQSMVNSYPESVEAAVKLVEYLSEEYRSDEVRTFLKGCTNQEILFACREYICPMPEPDLHAGTYTTVQTLELKAEDAAIYYTLDGSVPDRNSIPYTGPIMLSEGTTQLMAIAVNRKHIFSDLLSEKYVVVLKDPDPPVITPESGIYRKHTRIEIEVPDGCKAYYAFDNEHPSAESTEYKTPVALPQGYHTFYAVLVSANGKTSPVASQEYYLEY